jgi:S1-C subfamily serine protease
MSSEIQNLSTALEGVAAGVAASLVSVLSHRMQASGFVWRAGLVVTSDEGLAEEGEVRVVLPGGESTVARIVGRDASSAIALLKIERSDLRPVAMAATVPASGALVLTLGAEGGAPTAALGIVALSRGPWQSMRGGEIDARIELDVRLRSWPCNNVPRQGIERHCPARTRSDLSGRDRSHHRLDAEDVHGTRQIVGED